jgi:hypothetical protein
VNYNMGTSAANGFAVVWESQEKQEALMFRRTKMTAAMSQELIDGLTDHGRHDLSQLRMDDLEREVYELVSWSAEFEVNTCRPTSAGIWCQNAIGSECFRERIGRENDPLVDELTEMSGFGSCRRAPVVYAEPSAT